MKEEWKIIKDFENYSVSNFGNIKNIKTGNILKQNVHSNGYYVLNIKPNGRNGTSKTLKVHREVAIAFIENLNNLPQVNHIDGNKLNNVVTNLEWCTASENMKHAYSIGLKDSRGERSSSSKLTNEMVKEILDNPQIRNIEFAKKFNIDRSAISKIRSKKNWSHIQ